MKSIRRYRGRNGVGGIFINFVFLPPPLLPFLVEIREISNSWVIDGTYSFRMMNDALII